MPINEGFYKSKIKYEYEYEYEYEYPRSHKTSVTNFYFAFFPLDLGFFFDSNLNRIRWKRGGSLLAMHAISIEIFASNSWNQFKIFIFVRWWFFITHLWVRFRACAFLVAMDFVWLLFLYVVAKGYLVALS